MYVHGIGEFDDSMSRSSYVVANILGSLSEVANFIMVIWIHELSELFIYLRCITNC